MKQNLYMGIMTGTSMDGIDVALCRIDEKEIALLAYEEYPYDTALKKRSEDLMKTRRTDIETLGRLDAALGEMIADAALRFIREKGIDTTEISALGMHGQTLWHEPSGRYAFSWQAGDANRVAYRTGICVVSDVRRADMAAGGQGAPLAPALHKFIFKDIKPPFGVLNLGGIANVTIIDGEQTIGFDTGPANTLMDGWVARHQGVTYDADGAWARGGKTDESLLEAMLSDAYFAKPPPKSTGREYFNLAWVERYLRHFDTIAPQDVQRTLLELTARSVAEAIEPYGLKKLVVCGGGAHNALLLERIGTLSGVATEVAPFADATEAMLMAYLAYKRVKGEALDLSGITGAVAPRILGAVYMP